MSIFEDWAVTFNCGGEEKVGAVISSITSEKEEERKMEMVECYQCGYEMSQEDFKAATYDGCPNCEEYPGTPEQAKQKMDESESVDPLFDFMADFRVGQFKWKDWNKIDNINNENRDAVNQIRVDVSRNREIKHLKTKQLIKLIIFLQFAKDQVDDANTGLCQQDELQRANLDGFEKKLKDLDTELKRASAENQSLRVENRNLKHQNDELNKYNTRNNHMIGQATDWLAKITRMVTPYGEPGMSEADRRIKELENQLVQARAENVADKRSFVFRELRERQIFALFMNQQITVEQLSLLLGKDSVAEFNDWSRAQFIQHQRFHAEMMAAVLDWKKLTNESEVTKEILTAYLDSTRMQVSHGEMEQIISQRATANLVYPLSEEEMLMVIRFREEKAEKRD